MSSRIMLVRLVARYYKSQKNPTDVLDNSKAKALARQASFHSSRGADEAKIMWIAMVEVNNGI